MTRVAPFRDMGHNAWREVMGTCRSEDGGQRTNFPAEEPCDEFLIVHDSFSRLQYSHEIWL
jgi:hypothetical protein